MTSGSYPLRVESARCVCGQMPVMEWKGSGSYHRVVCLHCGAGSDREFCQKRQHVPNRPYTSSRELALKNWEASKNQV